MMSSCSSGRPARCGGRLPWDVADAARVPGGMSFDATASQSRLSDSVRPGGVDAGARDPQDASPQPDAPGPAQVAARAGQLPLSLLGGVHQDASGLFAADAAVEGEDPVFEVDHGGDILPRATERAKVWRRTWPTQVTQGPGRDSVGA